jgi:hypothetical protein
MTEFTPLLSLLGGALIGLSAVLLMAFHGRIAGMTGIMAGILPPWSANWRWSAAFLLGSIAAPLVYRLAGGAIAFSVPVAAPSLIVGGIAVGIGVTFGAGCPSGHGICGLARFSPRSLVAVITFMIAAFVTVYVIRHIL